MFNFFKKKNEIQSVSDQGEALPSFQKPKIWYQTKAFPHIYAKPCGGDLFEILMIVPDYKYELGMASQEEIEERGLYVLHGYDGQNSTNTKLSSTPHSSKFMTTDKFNIARTFSHSMVDIEPEFQKRLQYVTCNFPEKPQLTATKNDQLLTAAIVGAVWAIPFYCVADPMSLAEAKAFIQKYVRQEELQPRKY